MTCKGCGGEMVGKDSDRYVGPECWDGYCRSCSLGRPAYAKHLEEEVERLSLDVARLMYENTGLVMKFEGLRRALIAKIEGLG